MKLAQLGARIRRAVARSLRSVPDASQRDAPTLRSPSVERESGLALLFTCLIFAFTAAGYSSHLETFLDFYERNPEAYLAGTVPTARADSYYWFRVAREVREESWRAGEIDTLRAFPDGVRRDDPPILAQIIAKLADWRGTNVYEASQLLALISSCLFLFPLGVYAFRVGYPAAGLVAAAFAAASPVVFTRTAIYHVDTDALNLFGLWSISLAIASVPAQGSRVRQVVATLVAAIATALFIAWYERELFYIVFCVAFPICLWAGRVSRRVILPLALLFAIGANPMNLGPSIDNLGKAVRLYVAEVSHPASPSRDDGPSSVASEDTAPPPPSRMDISQNDLMAYIAEGRRLPLGRSLSLIGHPAWLMAAGLCAFLIWSILKWRWATPLVPMAALGSMGLLGANRFLLFLAPLVGLGLGLLYSFVVESVAIRVGGRRHAKKWACLFAIPTIALPLVASRPDWLAERPFSPEYILSLQRASQRVPAGSPVWSLWGHGYLLQDVMGAATYRDGLPDLEIGHFYLKGLTGDDPTRLARTIAFLQSHPQRDVRRRFWADYSQLDEEMASYDGPIETDTYLLLTEDSVRLFGSEFQLGQWTPESGWPPSNPMRRFYCHTRIRNRLQCGEPNMGFRVFDLTRGTIDGIPSFGTVRHSRRGFTTSEQKTRNTKPMSLQVVTGSDGSISVYPLAPRADSSLVNQMYSLAAFDERYFELVYDDFPRVRLYRFKSASDQGETDAVVPSAGFSTSRSHGIDHVRVASQPRVGSSRP